MYREKIVYVAFSTVHVFRYPPGVLEHAPHALGGTAVLWNFSESEFLPAGV